MLAFCALVSVAFAQEPALRLSVKNPTLRVEYGNTLLNIDDIFGKDWLDISLWAGAGATVNEGKLTGSFSALWAVPRFSQRVNAHLGIEYRAIQDQRPTFDLAIHFTLNPVQTVAVTPSSLYYNVRF